MAPRIGRHIGLKVVSIALAALLWLIISGQQVVERALRIPIEYTNLPANLEMTGDQPAVVDVRVRGSSAALGRIVPSELVAVLDLQSARPGQRLFHLTGTDVRAPFGVDVVQVTPSNISMGFEPSASKVVPVIPAVEGDPAPGFQVRTVSATPPTVEVVGPAGALKTLTEAITEPVSVQGASAPVRESVNVGVRDQAIRLKQPQSAMVLVDVKPAPVDRVIPHVRVTVHGADRRTGATTPTEVAVSVRGPYEAMSGIGPDRVDASVDIGGLAPGQYHVPVRVVLPSPLTVVQIDPERVQVHVR